jgi:Flp pilus assembly protein TadG
LLVPPAATKSKGNEAVSLAPFAGRARGAGRARCRDRGAAAVEFALLLPLLLLLVFGIIDFGRAINAQITLTQAARTGARLAALGQPNVVSATQAAATGLSPVGVAVTACPSGATQTTAAAVTASYSFSFVTPVGAIAGFFGGGGYGSPITLSATGRMPCES